MAVVVEIILLSGNKALEVCVIFTLDPSPMLRTFISIMELSPSRRLLPKQPTA